MNWINNVVRPRIQGILTKRDTPDHLWIKCPETGQMVFHKDLEANQYVIPGSGYHMRMSAEARLNALFDGGEYEKLPLPEVPLDPLKFRDERRYTDRLKDSRTKTNLEDAVIVGNGTMEGINTVAAVQDFNFLGGSLGMAAGEAIVTGMLKAVEQESPFIMFAASGGARMQEGILSLMQMPRTTVAVQRMRDAAIPYIVVLTHPTTGGVTASYAMLGDIHIAEPGALIGFAGPRVIEQTIREQLPEGFQRAEYLVEHGMVDLVVHRHKMRETLVRICRLLMTSPKTHANSVVDDLKNIEETTKESDEASSKEDPNITAHETSAETNVEVEVIDDSTLEILEPSSDDDTNSNKSTKKRKAKKGNGNSGK